MDTMNKEIIRGWLRNWITEYLVSLHNNRDVWPSFIKYDSTIPQIEFVFDMDSIGFQGREFTIVRGEDLIKSNIKVRVVTFYIDNIMRIWLTQHNMVNTEASKENLDELHQFILPSIEVQTHVALFNQERSEEQPVKKSLLTRIWENLNK
jgi:hypothetical protein